MAWTTAHITYTTKSGLSYVNLVTVQHEADKTGRVDFLYCFLLRITQTCAVLLYLSMRKGKRVLVLCHQDCKWAETKAKTWVHWNREYPINFKRSQLSHHIVTNTLSPLEVSKIRLQHQNVTTGERKVTAPVRCTN